MSNSTGHGGRRKGAGRKGANINRSITEKINKIYKKDGKSYNLDRIVADVIAEAYEQGKLTVADIAKFFPYHYSRMTEYHQIDQSLSGDSKIIMEVIDVSKYKKDDTDDNNDADQNEVEL